MTEQWQLEQQAAQRFISRWIIRSLLIALAATLVLTAGCPLYAVWEQKLRGQGELARATANRRIRIQEAEASYEAANKLAAADTVRAHGEARANAIIGESLIGERGQARLRYLWIQSLEAGGTHPSVIYVPTEAGLPLLEAGRRPDHN